MEHDQKIRTSLERNEKAMSLRASIGRGTAVTKVRLVEGLMCEIEDGKWKMTADMGEKYGSFGAGPDPGVLGRGALGSCLTMSYAMWAARLELPVSGIEVAVQADYDARGLHGATDMTPGYAEIRYVVTIESDAPEADLVKMMDKAEQHTPYYNVFSEPQALKREIRIVASKS